MVRVTCSCAVGAFLCLLATTPRTDGFLPAVTHYRHVLPTGLHKFQGRTQRSLVPRSTGAVDAGTVAADDAVREAAIRGFTEKVRQGLASELDDPVFLATLHEFLDGYSTCAVAAGTSAEQFQLNLATLIKMLPESIKNPYEFELFHPADRGGPVDLYAWGNAFFAPLMELHKSRLDGVENLKKIEEYLKKGENVFLISNHQTEADPQACSLLMERDGFGEVAASMINVAGHRVTTDPFAIPFSRGRNLFCVYSKKYMESPPELKSEKQRHNVSTLKTMVEMMSKGGQFIWVAPSGGRDRPSPESGGGFEVSPFDAKSVEVFRLMASKALGKKRDGPMTHFFPFAMWTNKLLPPPDKVNNKLGERRRAQRGPVSIAFGDEVEPGDMNRDEFAGRIEGEVRKVYAELDAFHAQQE